MALFNTELNSKVKIFSELYVGLRDQGDNKPKLGFATPLEKGSAFEKRKATVDGWAKVTRYDYTKKQYLPSTLETTTVENTLRPGFKITDDVKRVYWGGGNVVWRVLDPYGYELEIPSANLMAIIQVSGIGEGGAIPGKCCWGRDGATNILLHEKSDVYVNAIKNAEDIKKAKELHSKDRVVGATYVLQSGDTGTYLGKFRVHSLKNVMFEPSDFMGRTFDHYEVSVNTPKDRSCIGKLYSYEISDDGMFDAVVVEGDKNRVHFYRKAPIISRVECHILSEKTIQKIIDTATPRFAAAGKTQPIIHIAREVKNPLVFALTDMSDATYATVLANAESISKNRHHGFESLFYSHMRLPFGFTMGAEDNQIWQIGGNRAAVFAGDKNEEFFCPTKWTETTLDIVHCHYGRQYISGPYMKGTSFKTSPVPNSSQVVEWVKEMFANGYLKEIIVREKVN